MSPAADEQQALFYANAQGLLEKEARARTARDGAPE